MKHGSANPLAVTGSPRKSFPWTRDRVRDSGARVQSGAQTEDHRQREADRAPRGARDSIASAGSAVGSAALIASAITSLVMALVLPIVDVSDFIGGNQATSTERRVLLLTLFATFATTLLGTFITALVLGTTARSALHRWSLRLSPLCFAYAVPALSSFRTWYSRPTAFLSLLAILTLAFERTLRASLPAWEDGVPRALLTPVTRVPAWVQRIAPGSVVVLGAAAYTVYTAYYSIQQHQRLASLAYDLGIYDNLMFNALHGHFFRSPVLFGEMGGNYIAGHAEFIMLAYVPLYALWQRPEMLLTLQAALFGFAALPLYAFARTQVPRGTAALVAVAYLFYAPLHGPNFYDFHWLPTAIFFHFLLYYAIAKERLWLSIACVATLLLVREDVSVGLAILGVFLALTGIRVRFGMLLAVTSAVYFGVVKFIIMPWAGDWWFADLYKTLIPRGESGYGGVLRTLLTNPAYFAGTLLEEDKLVYALHLFTPVAFLPWRRPALALLASVGFFFTLMTTGSPPTISIAFQYTAHWVPYIFAASVLALRLLNRNPIHRKAATLALVFATFFHSLVYGALIQRETFVGGFGHIPFEMTPSERTQYESIKALVKRIPKDAIVAATESEVPHISSRMTAYALRDYHGGADYLLVNRNYLDHVHTHSVLRDAFTTYKYGLVEKRGLLFLFRRDTPDLPGTQEAKRELGLP